MIQKLHLQKHRLFFYYLPLLICKFIFVRFLLFKEIDIFKTLYLEAAYIIFFLSLIELIQNERIKRVVYFMFNLVVTGLLLGLVLYFKYSGQIVSIIMLANLNQIGTVKDSVFNLLHPVYLLLLLDLILFTINKVFKKFTCPQNLHAKNKTFLGTCITLSFLIMLLFIFNHKDDLIVNAAHSAEKKGIFTYEIICVIQLFKDPDTLTAEKFKNIQNEIQQLRQTTTMPQEARNQFGKLEGQNVIYIQLEAFQNFLINAEVNGQEITPFLNSLVATSLYFPNIYQQIAAGSTSDAEFISNTSLYPNTPGATTKIHGELQFPSLPRLLKEEGYTSMTMHANDVSFWNRKNLYPALGFDTYYDIEYFGEQQIIGIGPSDRVLFEKAIPIFKQQIEANQSFYAQMITLTSHHPFVMPNILKSMQLPAEMDESIVGDYIHVTNFVDQQLAYFFELLESEGILDNTVVVLYGDHQGLQLKNMTEIDLAILKKITGKDYSIFEQLNVPFIIHSKQAQFNQKVDLVGGQLDMLPTLANLLGVSLQDFPHFGQDLLNSQDNLFAVRYYLPHGTFFTNEIASIVYTNYNDSTLYNSKTGSLLKFDDRYSDDYKTIMKLLDLNDRYLNTLPKRDPSISTNPGK